jgi:hypothetical protein
MAGGFLGIFNNVDFSDIVLNSKLSYFGAQTRRHVSMKDKCLQNIRSDFRVVR